MHFPSMYGSIEIVCGPMFSGKTEELLRRIKRAQIARQKVQVFKPALDDRYSSEHVQSHNANRVASIPVKEAREILDLVHDNTRVVGVDEAQFFDESVVEIVQKLAYRGIRVVVAGLDQDFRGQPFGPMPRLFCIAEEVVKLTAVCVVCGAPATRTQRTHSEMTTDQQVAVGATEIYEPRCRYHHEPEATGLLASQGAMSGLHQVQKVSQDAVEAQKRAQGLTDS